MGRVARPGTSCRENLTDASRRGPSGFPASLDEMSLGFLVASCYY